MKDYRVFDVSNESYELKGKIKLKIDDNEKIIMKKVKELGLKFNVYKNKVIWWDDDYIEIIQKKSDKTVGVLEVCYR